MLDSTIWQDLRYAWRSLWHARSFAATALLTLALGIGGTSAIFSVVDAVLLEPLPLGNADRIVAILHHKAGPVAPANFLEWKRQSTAFSRIGATEYWTPNVTRDGPAEKVQALHVTTDAFALAEVAPALGRLFAPGEDESGHEHVAILAWSFWQSRFAGDQAIVGKSIVLDGVPYGIIGVMPAHFDFPMFWAHDVQLWAPLALGSRAANRDGQSLRVLARLKPGVGLGSARAEMETVTRALERIYPGTNRDVTVTPLRDLVVGDVRPALLVLLGAMAFVLLLACANVGHMLLARGAVRQREMTIRTALGASRGRVVRQLLTESLLLGVGGGILGLALAGAGVRALVALGGGGLPRADEIGLDARVVCFTLLVSLATGLLFGLAPAVRATGTTVSESLHEGGRTLTGSARQHRMRDLLVASEFALALVLLTGAGLAIRTFVALRDIDPGFSPRGVVSMVISFAGSAEAPPGQRVSFVEQLLDRVRTLPGVERVSAINHAPLVGDQWGLSFYIEGRSVPKIGEAPAATYRVVVPGYFATMSIRMIAGRDVAWTDRMDAPAVVVIDDFMARKYWPGQSAVGKRISFDRPDAGVRWFTVIGVVRNTVRSDWAAPAAEEVYVPWLQERDYMTSGGGHVGYMTLVVRAHCAAASPCDAAPLVPQIRNIVSSIDRDIPVASVRTMNDALATANARPRFTLVVLGVFAGVALFLATIGVYGVMSYAVSRRTQEIGVRLALGAVPSSVIRMVVGEGMTIALTGAAVGIVGAMLLTRTMASFLYGVRPTDPYTFGVVSVLLAAAALGATYLPARRASRTDPLRALRAE